MPHACLFSSNPRTSPAPCPAPTRHAILREPLLARLRSLPYPAFARLCARLLEELGYGPVRVKSGAHRKGRNAEGGYDIEALCRAGAETVFALAQVRQWEAPLPRSCVDELRGAMLRRGAGQGLILSASPASAAAAEAAKQGGGLLPVRLIAGDDLAAVLLARHMGVRPDPQRPGEWELDNPFFAALAEDAAPKRPDRCREAPAPATGAAAGLTLTLTFGRREGAR